MMNYIFSACAVALSVFCLVYTTKNKVNRRSQRFAEKVRETEPGAYMLTTGGCELCEKCTFPEAPCRRPDKQRGSLSAFGVDVAALCERLGMPYAFEPGKLRLMSCVVY